MKLYFVSGPYSSNDYAGVCENIMRARRASVKLWKQGYSVICPHSNTAHLDIDIPDPCVFIKGDLEMLSRCDTIYMLKNWESSFGAKCEKRLAERLGLETIYE